MVERRSDREEVWEPLWETDLEMEDYRPCLFLGPEHPWGTTCADLTHTPSLLRFRRGHGHPRNVKTYADPTTPLVSGQCRHSTCLLL